MKDRLGERGNMGVNGKEGEGEKFSHGVLVVGLMSTDEQGLRLGDDLIGALLYTL